MDVQSIMNYVLQKLKEFLSWFGNCWGDMLNWFDNCWEDMVSWFEKAFPPETRGEQLHHWLQVGAIFLIAVLVLIFFFYCCRCCCRCCCRGGRSGRPIKMMKAPGRNYRMPRNIFESNPRSYFRNLRANPSDELC